jgi:hypothetical protein
MKFAIAAGTILLIVGLFVGIGFQESQTRKEQALAVRAREAGEPGPLPLDLWPAEAYRSANKKISAANNGRVELAETTEPGEVRIESARFAEIPCNFRLDFLDGQLMRIHIAFLRKDPADVARVHELLKAQYGEPRRDTTSNSYTFATWHIASPLPFSVVSSESPFDFSVTYSDAGILGQTASAQTADAILRASEEKKKRAREGDR